MDENNDGSVDMDEFLDAMDQVVDWGIMTQEAFDTVRALPRRLSALSVFNSKSSYFLTLLKKIENQVVQHLETNKINKTLTSTQHLI